MSRPATSGRKLRPKGLTEGKASTRLVGGLRRNDLDAAQLCTNYPLERTPRGRGGEPRGLAIGITRALASRLGIGEVITLEPISSYMMNTSQRQVDIRY